MKPTIPLLLPVMDRLLLECLARIVPLGDRRDWLRCWRAELWHRRHPRSGSLQSSIDLYPGLIRDALWMRTHAWHQALDGTAMLCLLLLCSLLVASLLPLATALGNLNALIALVAHNFIRFLCEAIPVTTVGFLTTARTVRYEAGGSRRSKIGPSAFPTARLLLVLLIAFVWSGNATAAFLAAHRFAAELLQPEVFALLGLLALRWNFQDHEHRCKHCLRRLAAPARVGPPSWNFLDANGTELLCRDGHGLLSVPEMETSWRRSSRWIAT